MRKCGECIYFDKTASTCNLLPPQLVTQAGFVTAYRNTPTGGEPYSYQVGEAVLPVRPVTAPSAVACREWFPSGITPPKPKPPARMERGRALDIPDVD